MSVRAGPPGRDQVEDLAAVRRRTARRPWRARSLCGSTSVPCWVIGVPDMALVARDASRRAVRARVGFESFVHGLTVASLRRSSSGSMALSVARLTGIEPGNLGDDFDLAVALDRGAIMRRLRSVDDDAGKRQPAPPDGFERQQRVVDGAERRAGHEDNGQIELAPQGRSCRHRR